MIFLGEPNGAKRPGAVSMGVIRQAVILLTALLGGCVDSAAPLLGDAKPVLGPAVRLHGYTMSGGEASGPEVGVFRWDGSQYRVVGRPTFEVAAFTAVALGDDLIVQARSSRRQIKGIEYALAHRLADGVYQMSAIDEADADEATRAKFCAAGGSSSCRVATAEALLAFARATAAKPQRNGSLAIVMRRGR
jgi:hypothetical protein